MRTLIRLGLAAAMTAALLAPATVAQARGKRQHEQSPANAEAAVKKKALDADYKRALNSVPDSTAKQDPWKTMR